MWRLGLKEPDVNVSNQVDVNLDAINGYDNALTILVKNELSQLLLYSCFC